MIEEESNFYCNIIMPVMDDPNLKDKAKLLYGRISSLAKSQGYCWANNFYFADRMKCDINTISRLISDLQKGGYITVEIFKKEGNKRRIWLDSSYRNKDSKYLPDEGNLSTKMRRPIYQNGDSLSTDQNIGIDQNEEYNNITNKKLNKQFNNKKEGTLFSESAARVIVYLNDITGHSYKPENELHQKHIVARLKDGYTVEELMDIAAYKNVEWKGTKMEIHLVPKTLYNKENANKYRDQVAHAKKIGMTEAQIRGEKNKSVTNDWVKGYNSIK